MTNTTLVQWRKNKMSNPHEIQMRVMLQFMPQYISLIFVQMLEVANGVRYIHSEGIVHGGLRGVSVLIIHVVDLFIHLSGECLPRL